MLRNSILFIFLLSSIIVKGETKANVDSLIKAINRYSEYDKEKLFKTGRLIEEVAKRDNKPYLILLTNLAHAHYLLTHRKLDSSKAIYKTIINTAKQINNDSIEMKALIGLGITNTFQNNLNEAKVILDSVLLRAQRKKYLIHEINTLSALSRVYLMQGDYNLGIESLNNAIELARKKKDDLILSNLFLRLAHIESRNDFNESAQNHFFDALEIAISSEDLYMKSLVFNSLGNFYRYLGKIDSAIIYYEKSLENKFGPITPMAFLGLARALLKSGNENLAIAYSDSAISLSKKEKLDHYTTFFYLLKAEILYKNKKLKQALSMIDSCEEYIAEEVNISYLMNISYLKANIYSSQGQYDKGMASLNKYIEYSDSLNQLSLKKQLNKLQIKYELAEKERLISKKELDLKILEEKSRKQFLFLFGALSTLLILFLLYYVYNLKKTQKRELLFANQQIESIDEERNRIAKELHDVLGGNLAIIKRELDKIPKDDNWTKEITFQIDQTLAQTRNISHELYPAFLEKIDLKNAILDLLEKVQKTGSIRGMLDYGIENYVFSMEEKNHLFNIIQECVTNTLKHANANNILIVLKQISSQIIIEYKDDGQGLDRKEQENGFGFTSMKHRVSLLNGTMETKNISGEGLKIIFTFFKKR